MDNDASGKSITLLSHLDQPQLFGEDDKNIFTTSTLEVLVGYNVYRTWPINTVTNSGEMDNETCYILMSKTYLISKGLINDAGSINLDLTRDRFIIDGVPYKSSGDTPSSQAHNIDLLYMIILKRLKTEKITDYTIIQNQAP